MLKFEILGVERWPWDSDSGNRAFQEALNRSRPFVLAIDKLNLIFCLASARPQERWRPIP